MSIWAVDFIMVNGRKGFQLVEGLDCEDVRSKVEGVHGSIKVKRIREWL